MASWNPFAIEINRPPIFLCGPALPTEKNKPDRRLLLSDYIIKNSQTRKFNPIPIIIDPIIEPDRVKKLGLNLSLMEEIISAFSFQTYIFLDTISTGMELGLFSNSSAQNDITVFLPESSGDPYDGKPFVGGFIKNSIQTNPQKTKVREYPCRIEKVGNGGKADKFFVHFLDTSISSPIKDEVDADVKRIGESISRKSLSLVFSDDIPNDYHSINYYIDGYKRISFGLNFKTLIYLVSSFKDSSIWEFRNIEISDDFVMKTIERVNEGLLNFFVMDQSLNLHNHEKAVFLFRRPTISIRTNNSADLFQVVKHILFLIQFIQEDRIKKPNEPKKIDDEVFHSFRSGMIHNKSSFLSTDDLFGITKFDRALFSSYLHSPHKYVSQFKITLHGKQKKIITYSNNKYGEKLHSFHKKMDFLFTYLFESSPISFAYKKGISTLDCLLLHSKSDEFMKIDISDFFGSIVYSRLLNAFRCFLDFEPSSAYRSYFKIPRPHKRVRFNFRPKIDYSSLNQILHCCFYKNIFPIGFVTSPKLSDIYMNQFDLAQSKSPMIISRYSDDILLSCISKQGGTSPNIEMIMALSELETGLKNLSLRMNKHKTYHKYLKRDGDSLKFLGVNIVKTGQINRFTIGDAYIRSTCKEYCDFMLTKDQNALGKVLGKIHYIQNISNESFEKFKKMFKVKTGRDFIYIK